MEELRHIYSVFDAPERLDADFFEGEHRWSGAKASLARLSSAGWNIARAPRSSERSPPGQRAVEPPGGEARRLFRVRAESAASRVRAAREEPVAQREPGEPPHARNPRVQRLVHWADLP